jgi:hypothetical protein
MALKPKTLYVLKDPIAQLQLHVTALLFKSPPAPNQAVLSATTAAVVQLPSLARLHAPIRKYVSLIPKNVPVNCFLG